MSYFQQTPGQASYTFGLSGDSAARPKNLFYVVFQKAGASSASGWQKDLGFLVRSVDRPSVQPVTEEVNQYGRKRQVHVGVKYQPVRLQIYDTANSLALQMWAEYTNHYFGDFRHAEFRDDYRYDVTTDEFRGKDHGYGFAPQKGAEEAAQFFFDSIQVYQIFGKKYVQFDLINPRITAFDPDELDYQSSDAASISMTIAYEAIFYKNKGVPAAVSSNATLNAAFGDVRLSGDNIEIAAEGDEGPYWYQTPYIPDEMIEYPYIEPPGEADVRYYDSSYGTGPLTAYGQFLFGYPIGNDAQELTASNSRPMASDLSYQVTSNAALASALNLTGARRTIVADPTGTLATPMEASARAGRDAGRHDVGRAAVQALGNPAGRYDPQFILNDIADNAQMAASVTGSTAREQVMRSGRAPAGPNSWNSTGKTGFTPSQQTIGVINARRSPTSQLGCNINPNTDGGGS